MKLFIAVISLCLSGCSVFGQRATGARLERIKASKQYSVEAESFKNVNPNFSTATDTYEVLKDMIFGDQMRLPSEPLPEISPDLPALEAASEDVRFIWLGHSTFFLRIDGKTILIDPVLGPYASPVPIFGKRFQPALLTREQMPKIDFVVISHDHYDHLEMETVEHFAKTGTVFVVPLGIGAHLEGWGVPPERIRELDWWEETKADALTFTCTPAQHFSGRRGMDNDTLWASWVIRGSKRKLYYSGDSGYSPHFAAIGQKLGPFDLAFVEDGQYDLKWHDVHLLPEETVQAHRDLKGEILVPVHWGAYNLSFHDWFEPPERTLAEGAKYGVTVLTPKLGQLVELSRSVDARETWWRQSPDYLARSK